MKKMVNGIEFDVTPEEEAQVIAQQEASIENKKRRTKVQEIKTEGLSRITAIMPAIDTFEELETLRKFAPAFSLSANGNTVKDIYLYARTKVDQANTAPIATVEAYDPTTDPSWPT